VGKTFLIAAQSDENPNNSVLFTAGRKYSRLTIHRRRSLSTFSFSATHEGHAVGSLENVHPIPEPTASPLPTSTSTDPSDTDVLTIAGLARAGWSRQDVRTHLQSHRWQRIGRAVIRQSEALSVAQRCQAALLNAGPRAAVTSFTALQVRGLTGWERPSVYLVVARGSRVIATRELGVIVLVQQVWRPDQIDRHRCHHAQFAAVLAARSFGRLELAHNLLMAVIDQRVATPRQLATALHEIPRFRNRRALLEHLAIADESQTQRRR
jgi:hypothetical protein